MPVSDHAVVPEGSPGPAAPPPARPRRMANAVLLVVGLVLASIVIEIAVAALLVRSVRSVGALEQGYRATLDALAQVVAGAEAPVTRADVRAGQLALLRLGFAVVTVGIQATILGGLLRVRRWGWVGLVTWSAVNLLLQLYFYATGDPDTPGQYMRALTALDAGALLRVATKVPNFAVLTVHSLIVLALNVEDVQVAFGVRAPRAR